VYRAATSNTSAQPDTQTDRHTALLNVTRANCGKLPSLQMAATDRTCHTGSVCLNFIEVDTLGVLLPPFDSVCLLLNHEEKRLLKNNAELRVM
jgi:hypothetical protein